MIGIFQLTGILIPFAGMIALIKRKQQSESSMKLLLAAIGCMIMNSGYLLFLISKSSDAAMTALKVEYLGNAFFYFFFMQFLLAYLKIIIPKGIVYIWGAFECAVVGIYWQDTLREMLFGRYAFLNHERFHYMTVRIEQSTLYMIRYCALSFILVLGLTYGTFQMFRSRRTAEKKNLARLVGAQFVILISLILQLLLNPMINIVPMCASLSILSVVVSMHTDGFFGVKDWGYEWLFRQMEDVYVAVDNQFGFLDANPSAKQIFPQLERMEDGEEIGEEIRHIFVEPDSVYKVKDKFYERNITEIMNRGKIEGYTILLRDISEQQKHLELVQNYNARLKAEVAEKTRHIQLVQDSIITGIASVVESRDNSTGGHINRTSAIVRIMSKKLQECTIEKLEPEFLEYLIKVAPMHDLGKVAVDDRVLKKAGKFTEEEYEKMKAHSAEGAKVLQKVLAEVDDEVMTQTAINVAHFHHERWDGKGYPEGLRGENIPVEARIMALADVFDALVSKRCYKEAFEFERAFRIIEEGLGTQFDPELGKLFLMCRSELENLYNEMERN